MQKILTDDEYRGLNPSYDPGQYLDDAPPSQLRRFLDVDHKRELLSRILDRYAVAGPSRRFLDVGCGMGGYLLAARELGFDVLGFEPSHQHARVATEILKLPVIGDYFSHDSIPGQRFDLIMLSHVIEHILWPEQMLCELVECLNPGGVLVVVTPNSDSLTARLAGRRWVMLNPVDHVSMINHRAYRYFALGSNARVEHEWSEHPWEFGASLVAAIRNQMRDHPRDPGKRDAPAVLARRNTWVWPLKAVLLLLSAPFFVAATVMRRQACLLTIIVKDATGRMQIEPSR